MKSLLVIASLDPASLQLNDEGEPIISLAEASRDDLDFYKVNKPRFRRALILQELYSRKTASFVQPEAAKDLSIYRQTQSDGVVDFIEHGWSSWVDLGEDGRDPTGAMKTQFKQKVPPLIFANVPLPRPKSRMRPSKHPMGQIGYYCTDICTPMFDGMVDELKIDAGTVIEAVEKVQPDVAVYAMTTHPGHHASTDGFGGYCYLNHVAAAARLLQKERRRDKVAILDVDYHAGNGTADIFEEDPTVLVVSIHCDPDYDYPFHSGFADERGIGEGEGTTLHLPLAPGAKWETTYKPAVEEACAAIEKFGAEALVVSLGLDTYDNDPCSIQRAGFHLEGDDYKMLGETLAKLTDVPTIFVQEGGYRMDRIGTAAADVVTSFAAVLDKKHGKGTVEFGSS